VMDDGIYTSFRTYKLLSSHSTDILVAQVSLAIYIVSGEWLKVQLGDKVQGELMLREKTGIVDHMIILFEPFVAHQETLQGL